MNSLLQSLQGKKTHTTCLIVLVLVFGAWQKWWVIPTEVYAGLGMLAVMFLRAGVSREIGSLGDTVAEPGGAAIAPDGAGTAPTTASTAKTGAVGLATVYALFGVGVVILMAVMLLYVSGCASAKLEAGGAYAPVDTNGVATAEADLAFFQVDSAFDLADSTIRSVMKFERDNRAMLWKVSPNIKHELDKIRPAVVKAEVDYGKARKAYIANRLPANLTTLQEILGKAQQLVATAQAVVPQSQSQSQ